MAVDFRKVERQSNARANIFLAENIAILAVYLHALFRSSYTPQAILLAIFGVVYMIRVTVMARWLLKRELALEEITIVALIWLPAILASFIRYVKNNTSPFQLGLASILYVVGSYLNSYSEIQRKRWKEMPQNKGRCYTQGLFSLSRNINYFGDTLLFAGWALTTGVWWNAWVPVVMGSSFWFYHIPDKEKYLQNRYAKDWPAYKAQTPYIFVPWVC
jgi:steroid 5-alpha reductase family enzyme